MGSWRIGMDMYGPKKMATCEAYFLSQLEKGLGLVKTVGFGKMHRD